MQANEENNRTLENGLSKEFGQLTDEFQGTLQKGTNTIRFVARNNILVGRTVTYS